jgi:hypothetical protein
MAIAPWRAAHDDLHGVINADCRENARPSRQFSGPAIPSSSPLPLWARIARGQPAAKGVQSLQV